MIEAIKELRARTHLGMTECKRALEESQGDIDGAIEILQKKGLKKADDLLLPTEGAVCAAIGSNSEFKFGHIIEVNCQTDFGARSEVFCNLAQSLAADLSAKPMPPGRQPDIDMVSKQLGEKIVFKRSEIISALCDSSSIFVAYNHLGNKIAVLLQADIGTTSDLVPEYLENVAMQIAAMKPLTVDRASVSADLVAKKTATFEEDVKLKPEPVRAKIVEGKLNKWYSEVALLEQAPIFGDPSRGPVPSSVQAYLNELGLGMVKITTFIRYEKGELYE